MDELEGLMENSIEEAEELAKVVEHETNPQRWEKFVPLCTAILAVLATVAALLAAFSADREQTKRISRIVEDVNRNHAITQREVMRNREEHMIAQGKALPAADKQVLDQLEQRARLFHDRAEALEISSEEFNQTHHILALGITFFQVSIAVSAIALIARRRKLWLFSTILAVLGLIVSGLGGYIYFTLE